MEYEIDGASEGRRIWKGRSVGRERRVACWIGSDLDWVLEDPEGSGFGFDFEGLILILDFFETTTGGGGGGDGVDFLGGVAEM